MATENFLSRAPGVISEILLDHSSQYRNRSYMDREVFVDNRNPRQYEQDLDILDREAGICNSHILMVIINRLTTLQRRVQTETISQGKKKLDRLNREIGMLYQTLDNLGEGDAREGEIMEDLMNLKTDLRNYTDNVEQAKRIRIDNFYLDNMGKNRAASFTVTKEVRASRNIDKLIEQGEEITDRDRILELLHDNYFSTVGNRFQQTRTLESFLREHGVELPALGEDCLLYTSPSPRD